MRTITSVQLESQDGFLLGGLRSRVLFTIAIFVIGFGVTMIRIIDLGMAAQAREYTDLTQQILPGHQDRRDIVDRNGILLATDLKIVSLYANPRKIVDTKQASRRLAEVLDGLSEDTLEDRLNSKGSFVWLKRKLTPVEHRNIIDLGIPGVEFQKEVERLYPQGALMVHLVGYNDIDNRGLSGIEAYFDDELRDQVSNSGPLRLAVDARVQHALRDEISGAMTEFHAKGAAGIVLDVNTGEVLALVSLPDFNPNNPGQAAGNKKYLNRASHGVYEMGSTFKTFTMAMALEHGVATLADSFDATNPIHIARFTINDDHPKARRLTLPEIYMYSSNIGSAKMAAAAGSELQQAFLQKLGLLNRPQLELPEVGTPIVPSRWQDLSTMTVGFGHGIAISGLQLANGVAALVNGGTLYPPTVLLQSDHSNPGKRVIREATSRKIQALMRLVVEKGTGRNADAEGYLIGGKTGTAEKSGPGGYDMQRLVTSFVAAFPIHDPQYVVFVMLDEPHGNSSTYGYASAGWTTAPIVRRLVPRIAPLLGVAPTQLTTHPMTHELMRLVQPEVRS